MCSKGYGPGGSESKNKGNVTIPYNEYKGMTDYIERLELKISTLETQSSTQERLASDLLKTNEQNKMDIDKLINQLGIRTREIESLKIKLQNQNTDKDIVQLTDRITSQTNYINDMKKEIEKLKSIIIEKDNELQRIHNIREFDVKQLSDQLLIANSNVKSYSEELSKLKDNKTPNISDNNKAPVEKVDDVINQIKNEKAHVPAEPETDDFVQIDTFTFLDRD